MHSCAPISMPTQRSWWEDDAGDTWITLRTSPWWSVTCEALKKPTKDDLLAELKSCSNTRNLQRLKAIYRKAVESGNASCLYIATPLVKLFSKCGSMVDAHQVFDGMKYQDVVSWTTLISGYAENGEGIAALDMFAKMKSEGCEPDLITYVAALRACTSLALEQNKCLERGKQMHQEIGYNGDKYVRSALIDMYVKCGSMSDAQTVFNGILQPDVVSYTALMSGYAENGQGIKALALFAKMKSRGCTPDSKAFVSVLKACTSLAEEQDELGRAECLEYGKQIHSEIGRFISDMYVQSALIDMYAKCRSMIDARQVFDTIKKPDVVSWTALIMGYAENGESVTALELFEIMKTRECAPNPITFLAALKACSNLGALESGKKIHREMDRGEVCNSTILITCLVDFYGKCGDMLEAQRIFDSHCKRDVIAWNALLAGYSRVGDDKAVLRLFQEMRDADFEIDSITFLHILTSCSHAGLFDRAKEYFDLMSTTYGITPTLEHYTCMVDILGRSNALDDAMALLRDMPCKFHVIAWKTVLDACRKWKNLALGMLAFKSLLCLDDTVAAAYVLMAQIYRSRGMWQQQEIVLRMKKEMK